MTYLFLQNSHTNYYGFIPLIVDLFIGYQIGRRRFNHRSITGLQTYNSYFIGILTTIIENVLNIAGALSIIIGLITIIVHL